MVSRYVTKYSKIIADHLAPIYIRFPQNAYDRSVVKTQFFQKYRFPGVVGIIDGTHIAITAVSREIENAYVNRSGYHSVNAQIVCDANLSITNINARFPGSAHDAFIYGGSVLNAHLQRVFEEEPNITNYLVGNYIFFEWTLTIHFIFETKTHLKFLGDSAYPLSPWLMKKIDGDNLNENQRNFNQRVIGMRQSVERCIGVLKTRFRCIMGERELRYNPTRVGHIIYACAALHNYLIANRFDILHDIDHNILENLLNHRNENNVQQQIDLNNRQVAIDRREQLVNFLANLPNE